MIEFEESAEGHKSQHGFTPSHKITIKFGSDVYTYWYVQEPVTARPFDKMKDRGLVEIMFEKGKTLGLGQFESFEMKGKGHYHLKRLNSHEFLIKSLQ